VASKFPATGLKQQSRFYLPELDSLRFFAFLTVFLCHLPVASHWEWELRRVDTFGVEKIVHSLFSAGSYGVDLFFALSAYLITELLMQEKERTGSIHVSKFYLRRILRIWPLYFAFVAGCYLASQFNGAVAIAFVLFVGNFTFPLLLKHLPLGVQILWSISVEEQFYLIWPHVARFLTRATMLTAGIALWVATIIFRYISLRHGKPPSLIWYFSPARLDPLACGILISVLIHSGERNPLERFRPVLILAGIACWLIASFSDFNEPDAAPMTVVLAYILIAVGAGAFILAAFGLRESWFVHPWLVYLGRISYGLYIFHATVLTILVALLQGLPRLIRLPLYPILGLTITVAIAATSYQWFESPFLRLKKHFQYVQSAPE